MDKTRLSKKGQVVVPKRIWVAHSWSAGMEFTVVEREGGILLKPLLALFPRTCLAEVAGSAGYQGKAKFIHEMHAGIARKVRERHDRSR
jgi:bifunctional DNA-binding transcriptional regulator/antitoxin component of YhaV-PrlF toxin-antitoxin module